MTDITKYKNVSLSHKTYDLIDKIRKAIQPDTVCDLLKTVSGCIAFLILSIKS